MGTEVITQDAAKRQLAEAQTVVAARDIRDKAEALRTWARLAKDRDVEIQAAEIRVRAERRIGEMLIAHQLSPGQPRKKNGSPGEPYFDSVTLADLGIDKKLSSRAQAYARLAEKEFERRLAEWREIEVRRSNRVIGSLMKAVARPMAPAKTEALPDGKYRVIYADPPWQFSTWSEAGLDRSADNHYPTMSTAEICALQVERLAADDCVLFMWATDPMLRDAFVVLEAWGFTYKTIAFAWVKTRKAGHLFDSDADFPMGNGYWTRSNPENCLLATRGSPKRLTDATDVRKLVLAPRGRHSEKPAMVYDRIERLVDGPRIELFARQTRPGWDAWGNELAEPAS